MDYLVIRKNQQKVNGLINEKRLKEALDLLSDLVRETHNSEIIDSHYNLEMTYKSLLKYTVEGFTDPERQKIYNHLVTDIYKLADDTFLSLNTRFGQGVFYDLRRKYKDNPESIYINTFNNAIDELDKYSLMEGDDQPYGDELNQEFLKLFELLLSREELYALKDESAVANLFKGEKMPWPRQCIFVSAITIHLLMHFNYSALQLLFDLLKHPHQEIKQRALAGLLLVLYKYDSRLSLYGEITERLAQMKESDVTETILQTAVIQIMRTRETEKLARKLTDEILPEVARIHPNLRNRLDLDNIIGDKFKEGKNPDWEDIFSDSPELMNKLEEFSKLQMEGSDLFLSTFRMLKHFPFFSRMDNWFLPFSYPNPIVADILKNESAPFQNPDLLKGMAESGILCNSDKFSLILSIPQMPSAQKGMMGQMFMAEIGAIREIEKSDQLIGPEKQALSISNQYIQDLYRFFRVYPKKDGFEDPFSWSLDFYNKWFVQTIFKDGDFYLKLGEYLFNKDRYPEALECYNAASDMAKPTMQILQKQAFCHQQNAQYKQALDLYLKADLFNDKQVWNLKKIALCYRHLNNPEKALEYYQKAEKVKPDDLHNQLSIGHCLLELKDFEQALKYYFKVEYLAPDNKKVWRPIVWCALALGKFDQAGKYCDKLLQNQPSYHDYINMGHVKWCEKNREEALQWYQKGIKQPGFSMKEFLDTLQNDKEILTKHGVDETDIPIMIDQLRYYLQS
ncbi:tetratricopeptide repeat protein [Alkalitalea saponilacus]|uniref:Tetratricopeptide repeat-containing protein n=1 Tax=Alkalitalea saponilacus TaxID=889453 RepID=A0A1T5HQJ6_9BACT|nr:tetratricopeptide repeat protein [Alkalitalea saponilacus]ASB48426.1 hypothetical protein CDL62_04370 [Alkalitalea saponilacus]SKC22975.1 Tetratricopeptide repeat-containing protein [Alkalitalea saponilacus]